ncbi:hypothetical protein [Curtobacterium sp. BRD11]|nr:hypothetical protein [Curtobacterium sp. BRD11]MDT0211209.1 hypothetical protein [Curtobacterium sp. BRD11]
MTGAHGVLCACTACWTLDGIHDDDSFGKAIARAAEIDDTDTRD